MKLVLATPRHLVPVLVALDMDGTLVDDDVPVNYDDPASVAQRPALPAACAVARAMLSQGIPIAILTGRAPALREVTCRQVEEIFGQAVPVFMGPRGRHWSALVDFKADVLEKIGATLYIGDSLFDAWAAGQARVPFLRASRLPNFSPAAAIAPRQSPMVNSWSGP
jgi:hypothetical protein